jgi:hypothetical protein
MKCDGPWFHLQLALGWLPTLQNRIAAETFAMTTVYLPKAIVLFQFYNVISVS